MPEPSCQASSISGCFMSGFRLAMTLAKKGRAKRLSVCRKLLSAGAEAEGGSSPESTQDCEDEHQAEAAQMDKLGHLLSEVTSSTR